MDIRKIHFLSIFFLLLVFIPFSSTSKKTNSQVNNPCSCSLLRTASKQEIIKAYRKLAQQWHPDNFQSEEEKKKAEKKFIDIASAKEVLTDPGKYIYF